MKKDTLSVKGKKLPLYSTHTLVIGSGTASLNAAVHLKRQGMSDTLIVTNELGGGISANAGSDKQTYYKLSLSDTNSDSPVEMAESYFESGATHGDLALTESALSAREFFHLAELGVNFPFNEFGEYVGYKTDHDPRGRGTSAGPWTSQQMVKHLVEEVKRLGVEIKDKIEIIGLLTNKEQGEKRVVGALGIDKTTTEKNNLGFVVFRSENVIFGVGGPGGLYEDSVYPEGHIGSIGLALEKGAVANNLTEGQFGLASVDFRWNLSGSYQQVIPRYYSVDESGSKRDFLNEVFPSIQKLAEAIFLKGYQWPFDPDKVEGYGSSLIDLMVYRETRLRDRQVFMDFRQNPVEGKGLEKFNINQLKGEPKEYLDNSGALGEKPLDRLKQLNPEALKLYRQQGIDLAKEPLRIAVCAQHNNGGLRGNRWWESNIAHLFPVGEVNGSHGISRPGGSALNAGQVGGLRAAQYISEVYSDETDSYKLNKSKFKEQVKAKLALALAALEREGNKKSDAVGSAEVKSHIQKRMSRYGALLRKKKELSKVVEEIENLRRDLRDKVKVSEPDKLPEMFQALHLAITSQVYLDAINWYIKNDGGSRGSYMIGDSDGEKSLERYSEDWKYRGENEALKKKVQETKLDAKGNVKHWWVSRREIPESPQWFENVWRDHREGEVYKSEG
ncbi:FAD-binding protein [Candidatus Bipolaricaulota bacterium]|nr:FAD-binding protein [Candidatus Bipolaricaulota bacterium]